MPNTPAFLKGSLRGSDSPALPAAEASAFYGSELGSSVVGSGESTPVPQITTSSAQSTPLAVLPKRDAVGTLNEQGNLMTLREQENVSIAHARNTKVNSNCDRSLTELRRKTLV